MIIWRGWGILAALIPAAFFILFAVVFGIGAKGTFLASPTLMIPASGVCSAVVVWWLGRKLNSASTRELVDPKTGQRVLLRNDHSLFWIPMQWWAIPIVLLAGVIVGGMVLGQH